MNTKLLWLTALPIAAAGYVAFGHDSGRASAEPAPIARPATLVAPGRVEPVRDPVALAFESPGRIVAIDVDEGDSVTAGQVIARLDDRMANARVASAQAAVAQAEAHSLLAKRGPRREDLDAARADADAASAEAEHRALEETRSEKLGTSGAIPSATVDADTAAAKVARASSQAAAARYRALANGTRAELVQESAAALDAAKAELDAAKVALDQTLLRAPHDGVILRRTAEVGALVVTTSPLTVVTMADLRQLEVRAEVDEADVAQIALGHAAYVTADAFGDKQFPVHLARVTHELGRKTVRDDDPRARVDTRVLEVIARFDTPVDLPLGLRMSVHVGN